MNILYLLPLVALVIFCEGAPIISSSPTTLRISTFSDENSAWFQIKWSPAITTDEANPILGYKVKIWQVEKIKTTKFVLKDNKLEQVEVEALPAFKLSENPKGELTIKDVPANTTEITYTGVKVGVTYEVGVLPYTAKEVGSFSNKIRVTVKKI